ncbi:hypothetical protein ACFYY5_29030 [Nocardia elegans]|uniref:Uncharacterized protein n=1 Tax=Nocardia elegans TaxID=300029 RepID=A0ABW6TL88_9NOCA
MAVEYDTERDLEGDPYKIINPDAEVTAEEIHLAVTEAPHGWGWFANVTVKETTEGGAA